MKGAGFAADFTAWVFGDRPAPLAETASLWIGLHTGAPDASTEATYPGYERVRTMRGSDWNIDGAKASNARRIEFAECGEVANDRDGSRVYARVTHFAVYGGAAASSQMLYATELKKPMDVRAGLALAFKPGALTVTER